MQKRIITVIATFDMSKFQEDIITPKEKVKEIATKNMIKEFGGDKGYIGIEVNVKNIQ